MAISKGERREIAMIDRRPVIDAATIQNKFKPSVIQARRIFIQKNKAIRSGQAPSKI